MNRLDSIAHVNPVTALALFVGIPVLLATVISLAVFGRSWTRSARGDVGADDEGPLFITTAGAPMDPSRVPREIGMSSSIVVGGGAHGQW